LTLTGELAAMLYLKTLGTFELIGTVDGAPVRLMGPQKPLAMLAYIALAPGRRVTRDHLVDLLWQNLEVERGRRTLRQTLFSLRQKLGDVLGSDGEYVLLTAPLTIDCQRFEDALEREALEDAWARYTGPFVADFATPGSAAFEQWCDRQRNRLQAAWFSVGEELVRRTLVDRPREAATMAGVLRDAAPDRADLWSTRLRALLLAGERVEARAEAQRLQQLVAQGTLSLTAEIRSQLRALESGPTASIEDASADDQSQWRRPELVGRESAFALLLSEWRSTAHTDLSATASRGGMWVVRGSPGIGKTMLLDEFAQRARAVGGQVLTLRARRVNADTPYALAASLADRAASLPGAMGVSPATAAILVDLSPALSSVFRAAAPRTSPASELPRVRTQAIQELLVNITDERPTLIILDDLDWADEPSRQVIATLGETLAGTPLLLVVATRPTRRWVAPDAVRYLDLPPLSLEQIELLLASVASSDPLLQRELATLLVSVSGGVPLLAVSAMELALERQLLSISGDRWQCPDLDALKREFGQGGVLEKLLAGVSPAGRKMLTALAVADGALSDDVLAASVSADGSSGVVDELVQRGLVVPGLTGLEIAHDELADAAITIARPEERREIMRRVGGALLQERATSALSLALAGRLLAEAGDREAERAFARWLDLSADPQRWRDPMRAAADFLGTAATPHMLTQLTRSVPWMRRFTKGRPHATRMAMAGAVLLLVLGIAWSNTAKFPAPVGMQLVEPPSTDGFIWLRDPNAPIPVSLGTVFVDARGLPTPRGPDSVTVTFEAEGGGQGQLQGNTTRAVVNGRVNFTGLTLSASALGQFVVRADGFPPVRSRRLVFIREQERRNFDALRILSGTINGQPLDTKRPRVIARPGVPLVGSLRLQSVTSQTTAALLAGAVGLWGDRRTNFLTLQALPPHGLDYEMTVSLEDQSGSLRVLRAPTLPGEYQLLVLYAAETEFRFAASGTNWVLGEPQWDDGNDIADFTPRQIEDLRTNGWTIQSVRVRAPLNRKIKSDPQLRVGFVIDVVVEP
jgi:DNA-binding SARP family transcriptional activator